MELLLLFASHKFFPISTAPLSFLWLLVKTYILHKLGRVLLSLILKNLARPLLIFNGTFVFGYYKEFTFVLSQNNCQLFYKDNSVNHRIYHTVDWRLVLMTLTIFSNFKFNFDWTVELSYRSKINSHSVYVIKKKTGEKGFIQV